MLTLRADYFSPLRHYAIIIDIAPLMPLLMMIIDTPLMTLLILLLRHY
jgi:hypothetical protein